MTPLRKLAPILVVALWLGAVAERLALVAAVATEPPIHDAATYAQKSFEFWRALHTGKLFNPFNLRSTVRPPGTILMSYPFGWSTDYRWFYFRSSIIPILLFVVAVYIAGWSRHLTQRGSWVLAALALALAGMPVLYQFQQNERLPSAVYWGMVDGFLGGVCAIAAAAAHRSIATRSVAWATVGFSMSGLALWIKPSGLVLMALVGLIWLILAAFLVGWRFAGFRRDQALRRFVTGSLMASIPIFAVASGLAFGSEYFSANNIAFGQRVLVFFKKEYVSPVNASVLAMLIRTSFGYAVPAVTLLGLLAALRRNVTLIIGVGPSLAALLCLLVGIWYWLFETEPGQVRYFLPFGTMAFVLVIPALIDWAEDAGPALAYGGLAISLVPTALTTAMLLTSRPSDAWQRAMGINLHVGDFRAENEQGAALLNSLKAEGRKTASIYLADVTPTLNNVQAAWGYSNVTDPTAPQVATFVPLDWQRPTTLRVEDLLRCDFIGAEFMRDAGARDAILARRTIADFPALKQLIKAWVSGLDEADGVTVVSETRVRVLRITDRGRFDAAIVRLEEAHDLPQAYRDANPQRWWSARELAARGQPRSSVADIAFHSAGRSAAFRWIRAAEVTPAGGGLQFSLWLESGPGDTFSGRWDVFAHLIGATGTILGGAQIELLPGTGPLSEKAIRFYTVFFPSRPKEAVAVAFGIFRFDNGQAGEFLTADRGSRDWDNRRVILPLPASQ